MIEPDHLVQIFLAAMSGGGITAVGSYVGMSKKLARHDSRIEAVEKDHNNCRLHVMAELDKIDDSVREHHESGPHITDDYKKLMTERYDTIQRELAAIRKLLPGVGA